MKKLCKNINETKDFADKIILLAKKESLKNDKATVVALSGDLGSGKTAMVKILGEKLGIKERMPSPTFVIEKIYKLPEGFPWKKFIHIDAYRLDKESEIIRLGWNEIISDNKNIIFIEWPENVKKIIPQNAIWITFSHKGETERLIEIK